MIAPNTLVHKITSIIQETDSQQKIKAFFFFLKQVLEIKSLIKCINQTLNAHCKYKQQKKKIELH